MTLEELAVMIRSMRESQRRFLLDRKQQDWESARQLERRVDQAVREILDAAAGATGATGESTGPPA